MKVVCINNKISRKINIPITVLPITIGKSYDILKESKDIIRIVGDDNILTFYKKSRFISLTEWRDRQLDTILNEGSLYKRI